MSIYRCPHCGEKTFNPITKAMAGQLNSRGKECPNCGTRCVNGKAATIFNAIYSLLVIAMVVYIFLNAPTGERLVYLALIASLFVVPRVVNAFCFKMEEAIRIEM